ncbi:AsmA family protein [Chitinolyticbacter albus]|uniref:AsmA family protein n=1 Tax=Chitinolyticbacter albus TaxID=2961951 RepID=UPI00210CD2A7|nr:AsmA family protein [Chitinolyticbacter albus]
MRRPSTRHARFALGLIVMACMVAAVVLFEWNMLRGPIASRISAATGRDFAIRGDLTVRWGRQPTITARDIILSNASWSTEHPMVAVRSVSVRLDPWPLFSRRVVLPLIDVDAPRLLLERSPRGEGNWQGLLPARSDSAWVVAPGAIRVNDGKLRWLDRLQGSDVVVQLQSSGMDARSSSLLIRAAGHYQRLPLALDGHVGSPERLQRALADQRQTYPVMARGRIGATRVYADGTVRGLTRLEGLDTRFSLSGASLAELYPLIGVPLPASPRYAVKGRLQHAGAVWNLTRIIGRVGQSDIAGDFHVDRGRQPRQFIRAHLTSQRLDFADLSGFLGAREPQSGKVREVPGSKVLPQAHLSVEKLSVADADVTLRGRSILTGKLPLDDFSAHLLLKNGVLTLDPLDFGMAGGDLKARLQLDSRATPIRTNLQLEASRLSLRRLAPKLALNEKASAGLIGGRAQLAMRGDSVAQMAASADGEVAMLMRGGKTSKLLMRLANLDLAYSTAILLFGDEQIDIRCAVAGFTGRDGRFDANTLVLDTEKQLIDGQGWIDLKAERLLLQLKARPKDVSLVALRGPILVDGPLGQPRVRASLAQPTGRVAVAAALATVAPWLALLPLVELGGADDAPCAALLAHPQTRSAQKGATPPVKPTPQGQPQRHLQDERNRYPGSTR